MLAGIAPVKDQFIYKAIGSSGGQSEGQLVMLTVADPSNLFQGTVHRSSHVAVDE
jgi:hypothetical protein